LALLDHDPEHYTTPAIERALAVPEHNINELELGALVEHGMKIGDRAVPKYGRYRQLLATAHDIGVLANIDTLRESNRAMPDEQQKEQMLQDIRSARTTVFWSLPRQ